MKEMRDYNKELLDTAEHKYAYDFDIDVMHKYMMRSFEPFVSRTDRVLEIGSYHGAFTSRLVEKFDDVSAVEASSDAVKITEEKFGDQVKFINSTFEDFQGNSQYDSIFLTHTLEHLDDPIGVLRKVNQWLTDNGRLFLVVPNAEAPSRQIAVKMGLISHNAAVTESEAKHGHRITYSFDTLERDVVASGLKITHKSGIFFKPLANFQFDRLMKTDIISPEYLEGCYKLGLEYPRLCASIFFVCSKGHE
ncbi:MAG TPA: class I SAM-dependent methyltransferase [Pyrinomonadaceae bacterium]|nr:class I SAM-dependent methyltransferase [Pyrinomonadaceae bacterium]